MRLIKLYTSPPLSGRIGFGVIAWVTRKNGGDASMCKLCAQGNLQNHYFASRRDFLKGTAAIGATTAGLGLFAARPAAADDDDAPEGAGRPGRRYIIRGGSVMTMDPRPGVQTEFAEADVLV